MARTSRATGREERVTARKMKQSVTPKSLHSRAKTASDGSPSKDEEDEDEDEDEDEEEEDCGGGDDDCTWSISAAH
eukprot:767012-Hanusia_phi.AAC.1